MAAACDAGDLDDDPATRLKLQKPVLLAQGASLHHVGGPLFRGPSEARDSGPVRHCFAPSRVAGARPVLNPLDETGRGSRKPGSTSWTRRPRSSAAVPPLRRMTGQDEGWLSARKRRDRAVSLDDMRRTRRSRVKMGDPVTVEMSAEEAEIFIRARGEAGPPESGDEFHGRAFRDGRVRRGPYRRRLSSRRPIDFIKTSARDHPLTVARRRKAEVGGAGS